MQSDNSSWVMSKKNITSVSDWVRDCISNWVSDWLSYWVITETCIKKSTNIIFGFEFHHGYWDKIVNKKENYLLWHERYLKRFHKLFNERKIFSNILTKILLLYSLFDKCFIQKILKNRLFPNLYMRNTFKNLISKY